MAALASHFPQVHGSGKPNLRLVVLEQFDEDRDGCRADLSYGLEGSPARFGILVLERFIESWHGRPADSDQALGSGPPNARIVVLEQFGQPAAAGPICSKAPAACIRNLGSLSFARVVHWLKDLPS